jgi:hydroxymethylbilane synthase
VAAASDRIVRALADRLLCAASSLAELAGGARVGTSSLRRRAQLLAARPDLRVADLHGTSTHVCGTCVAGTSTPSSSRPAGLQRLGWPCDE